MELVRPSKKAFTLIELVIFITTFSVIMLAAGSMMVSHLVYFRQFRAELKLQQDAAYTIERLRNAVAGSEHVSISTISPVDSTLTTFDREGEEIGTFTRSGVTLQFQQPGDPLPPAEVISDYIGGLSFSDKAGLSNNDQVRLLKVNLQTSDPSVTSASGPHILTAISCRLTPNFPYPVINYTKWSSLPVSERWKASYYTIQAAVNDADPGNVTGDEIRCKGITDLFCGTFPENVSILNRSITLGGSYDEDFDHQDISPDTRTTIIPQSGGMSVVTCFGSFNEFRINGFQIQDGEDVDYGGGICVWRTGSGPGKSVITNNIITKNYAMFGGGILVYADRNIFTSIIANNEIKDNKAGPNSRFTWITGQGGGIYVFKSSNEAIDSTISNNLITSNVSLPKTPPIPDYGSHAGGIWVELIDNNQPYQSVSRITNNEIAGNTAWYAGGVYCYGCGARTHTVENNIIAGNTSIIGAGGISLIIFWPGQSVNITNNTIKNNTALSDPGDPFHENTSGGGMHCWSIRDSHPPGPDPSIVNISNNIISDNTASFSAGGIFFGLGDCTEVWSRSFLRLNSFTMANNIIAGNHAHQAAGMNFNVQEPLGFPLLYPPIWNFSNNTIAGNTADISPGGMSFRQFIGQSTLPELFACWFFNTICYNNLPRNLVDDDTSYNSASWSDIGGLEFLVPPPDPKGNIDVEPQFVNTTSLDPNMGYYRLQDILQNQPIITGGWPVGTQMGACGGPGAGTIGYVAPTADDPSTPDIREDFLGPHFD